MTNTNQEIVENKQIALTKFDRVKTIMRSEEAINRFAEVVGNQSNARHYISSVLVAVGLNEQLAACTPLSIMQSAMRAATLKLTVDPTLGHAYLVPFKDKATFVIGYKGYMQLALRTGKYKFINVATIYYGQDVEEDQMRGLHKIVGKPNMAEPAIGYMLYFELRDGFKKTYYMTVEQIKAHAERYSKSYKYQSSPWQTNFHEMCQKTVIRLGLSKFGYFNPTDYLLMSTTDELIDDEEDQPVEADWMVAAVEEKEEAKDDRTPGELVSALGYEDEPVKNEPVKKEDPSPAVTYADKTGRLYGLMSADELQVVIDELEAFGKKQNKNPKMAEEIKDRLQVARGLVSKQIKEGK